MKRILPVIAIIPLLIITLGLLPVSALLARSDRFLVWWLRRGRNWWSWLVRRISERQYLDTKLPTFNSLEEIEVELKKVRWSMENVLALFDCVHYPQRTWFKWKADADDFASLAAELLYRWNSNCNPVLVTALVRPIQASHTVCVFDTPQGTKWFFDNNALRREDCKTFDEVVIRISEGAERLVCWDIRNPITLEMLECHVPQSTIDNEKYLAVELNPYPGHWTCVAQCPQCLYYNVKEKRCMTLDKRIDVNKKYNRCLTYLPATSHAVDIYHIRSSSYYSFIAAAILSAIPLALSYVMPPIISVIVLGFIIALLLAMLRFGYDELNENSKRGLRSPFFSLRSLIGAICLILAPLVQILFIYQLIPVGYISWILLTGGLALAVNRMDIDIRDVEEGELVDKVMLISSASLEETEGLDQEPFGMRIEVTERLRTGTNTIMTISVANNTDETKAVELKYVSPCFEPQEDSVPLKLKAKSVEKVKFVVHVSASGHYAVSARILDSQNVITGINKQISSRIPSRFREPLAIMRAVMGVAALLITAIELIPDIIGLF